MDKQSLTLIKRDVSQDATIEIVTYQNNGQGMAYITYRNHKQIAWSSSIECALDNHQMFVNSQILKLVNEVKVVLGYYSGERSDGSKANNSFLHDFV